MRDPMDYKVVLTEAPRRSDQESPNKSLERTREG